MAPTIQYGKHNITLYRSYAQPLRGITRIPESEWNGRDNILFAADIDVEVFGDNFLPAYTLGDNRNVVATDTMKNFVLQQALYYQGATLEGLLDFLGRQLLQTYPQMQVLRLTGREQPFVAAPVPSDVGFEPSQLLFRRSHDDYSLAVLDFTRSADGVQVSAHRCGRVGLQLIKISGSSFADFARDAYTTLPEVRDRPLFIYLDVFWRYADVAQLLDPTPTHYVAGEQVRDLVQVVFHSFVSMSIQHLVHEMGARLLDRFPQLVECEFVAQNRLWDTAFVSEADERIKVYCDPRPPYGQIGLTLRREAS